MTRERLRLTRRNSRRSRHELIRLQISLGNKDAARSLLDQIISSSFDLLPVSARNEFLEQRTLLAKSMTEFLKFSQRKPVGF